MRSPLALVGVFTLAAGLTLGTAGVALAEEVTAESVRADIAALVCAEGEVAGASDVEASIAALTGLDALEAGDLRESLDAVVADCAEEPPVEEPPGEQPPMEEPPGVDDDGITVGSVREKIDALDCDGFAEQVGSINDDLFVLVGDATAAQLGALSDALSDRARALGFCVDPAPSTTGTTTPVPTTTTVTELPDVNETVIVNHIDDDDSTVTATQVRVVPEGSVATGAA